MTATDDNTSGIPTAEVAKLRKLADFHDPIADMGLTIFEHPDSDLIVITVTDFSWEWRVIRAELKRRYSARIHAWQQANAPPLIRPKNGSSRNRYWRRSRRGTADVSEGVPGG